MVHSVCPSSCVRRRPPMSYCSRPKPMGSRLLWQPAQLEVVRCAAYRSYLQAEVVEVGGWSTFTLAGGGSTLLQRSRVWTKMPRCVGLVSENLLNAASTLPCDRMPSRPVVP